MKEEESATQLVWWSERQLTRLFSVGGKKQINIARQTLPKFQISSASVQYTPQLRNHPHHSVGHTVQILIFGSAIDCETSVATN